MGIREKITECSEYYIPVYSHCVNEQYMFSDVKYSNDTDKSASPRACAIESILDPGLQAIHDGTGAKSSAVCLFCFGHNLPFICVHEYATKEPRLQGTQGSVPFVGT